ncbi:MAG: hypothetical protein RLY86_301 [Pseudomonadota bacterium]|jgi:sulfite exporter TauE/SafE
MHDHAPAALTVAASLGHLWPLASAMFLTGLVGGFGHCTAMCGPFVLAQVAGRIAGRGARPGVGNEAGAAAGAAGGAAVAAPMPVLARARGGLLIPYHLGRLTTYAGLGGLMAGLSGLIVMGTGFRWVLGLVLGIAALMFLGQALKGIARWVPALGRLPGTGGFPFATRIGGALSGPLKPLLSAPGGANGYLLGLVLGFLPCGFLYAALASAVGTGSAAGGVLVMGAFALGTVPSLITVGVLGSVAGAAWTRAMQALAPALMLFNAGVVGLMAWHALGR